MDCSISMDPVELAVTAYCLLWTVGMMWLMLWEEWR